MYHMLAVERSKIGFSEADAGRNPESWISLEPFASTMCRSIYTCSSGLTRRSGCTRKASYVGHETEPPKTTLGLGYTKSHWLAAKSVTSVIMFYPISSNLPCQTNKVARFGFPFRCFGTASLKREDCNPHGGMPRPKHMRFLSSRVSYWVLLFSASLSRTEYWLLLCSLHSCVWKIFYANTRLYVTSQSGPPTPKPLKLWLRGFQQYLLPGHLDQNFLSTFWSSSQRCLLLPDLDIWRQLAPESPNSRHPQHPQTFPHAPPCPTCPTCPTCIVQHHWSKFSRVNSDVSSSAMLSASIKCLERRNQIWSYAAYAKQSFDGPRDSQSTSSNSSSATSPRSPGIASIMCLGSDRSKPQTL